MTIIYPVYHQYRNLDTLYVFKFKNKDQLTLKIFDDSQQCLFKNTISSRDLRSAQVRQIFSQPLEEFNFSNILESLVQTQFLSRRYFPQQGLQRNTTTQRSSDPFDNIGSFFEGVLNIAQKVGEFSERVEVGTSTTFFGSGEWSLLLGDVGKEPSLPSYISNMLKTPCPYHFGKSIKDTHMLVLIPKTIDGMPFTLKKLNYLVKNSLIGFGMRSNCYEIDSSQVENKPVRESYWILITKDVIPKSRNKTYSDQQSVLENGYTTPTVLELATAIITHYAQNRFHTLSIGNSRCQEKLSEGQRMIIGLHESSGIRLFSSHDNNRNPSIGVMGVRRFY